MSAMCALTRPYSSTCGRSSSSSLKGACAPARRRKAFGALRFQLGDALLGSLLFGFQLAVAVGLGARELLRALFDLRAQLGDRLLRGGQTLSASCALDAVE
ncbi:hypothetical protein [Blautia stercoris]